MCGDVRESLVGLPPRGPSGIATWPLSPTQKGEIERDREERFGPGVRRLRQLDYRVTRGLVVAGATALLAAIAILAWARGVDPVEAVGVALYMPVFLAAVLLGSGEGVAAGLPAGGGLLPPPGPAPPRSGGLPPP